MLQSQPNSGMTHTLTDNTGDTLAYTVATLMCVHTHTHTIKKILTVISRSLELGSLLSAQTLQKQNQLQAAYANKCMCEIYHACWIKLRKIKDCNKKLFFLLCDQAEEEFSHMPAVVCMISYS